ncbi:MAG: alginate export family protein, partial [Candidatus Sumerlaeaceae bacterium]
IEGNLASGDRRFGDGENNTFNPLFGSSHTPYGIIDFVRLQNLREVALNYSIEPTSKLKLQAEAHHYWLDSRTDAWFGGPGLRDKTGQSGRDLGDELSLVAKYKLTKRVSLEGGFSHFFPGNFPRKAGKTDGANFFYLQYELQL